jgi:hypothetical protein
MKTTAKKAAKHEVIDRRYEAAKKLISKESSGLDAMKFYNNLKTLRSLKVSFMVGGDAKLRRKALAIHKQLAKLADTWDMTSYGRCYKFYKPAARAAFKKLQAAERRWERREQSRFGEAR